MVLKVPKDAVNRKRKRAGGELHCDYLEKHQRPANRARTDPVVTLSTILEAILNEMRDLPDVQPFIFPVNTKVILLSHHILHLWINLFTHSSFEIIMTFVLFRLYLITLPL